MYRSYLLFLQKVKNTSKILSAISILLVIVFLMGSSGAILVFHSCNAHGKEIHADLFVHNHSLNSDCCHNTTSCTPVSESNVSIDNNCCTFKVEKFKLTNFNPSVQLKINTESQIITFCHPVHIYDLPEKPYLALFFHNKHGGRDVLTSNCQFII